MLIVTTISASILGLLLVKLSLNVIGFRQKHEISIGDGENEDLRRAMRIQANLCEYAPIGLILLACLELNHAPIWLTAILAAAFVTGRLMHPVGMKSPSAPWQYRVRGMKLTILALIALAVCNLILLAFNFFAG